MKMIGLTIICISLLLSACHSDVASPRIGKDIAVAVSPDQRFKATVRELNINGSIGVSQPYQLLVESLIEGQPGLSVMLEADKTDGFSIEWDGVSRLHVCYGDAQITHFRNLFIVATEQNPTINECELVLVKKNSLSECTEKRRIAKEAEDASNHL